VASRSDESLVLEQLRKLGLDEWFLYPQVHWGSKSTSIAAIVEALKIGADTILFVDDDPFERAEVEATLPDTRTDDGGDLERLLARPDLNPPTITPDARSRRIVYRQEMRRAQAELDFEGSTVDFLATLELVVAVRRAQAADLERAEELVLRTNQLNATGYTYSREELDAFRHSPAHTLLAVDARDRFGSYGTVALVLLEQEPGLWTIKLLLTSCRVVSRGVGAIVLDLVIARARSKGVALRGEFVATGRNRLMQAAYRFAGFAEVSRDGPRSLLELAPSAPVRTHPHVDLEVDW
jgi:FkbH-like protein